MRRFFAGIFIFLLSCTVDAVEYRGPDGLSFDLPEGWSAFGDAKSESFSFTNSNKTAFLQVFRFTSQETVSLEEYRARHAKRRPRS